MGFGSAVDKQTGNDFHGMPFCYLKCCASRRVKGTGDLNQVVEREALEDVKPYIEWQGVNISHYDVLCQQKWQNNLWVRRFCIIIL